jgi:hydrogenase maturation protein HypF
MELESIADKNILKGARIEDLSPGEVYEFDIVQKKPRRGDGLFEIDMMNCIRQITVDLRKNQSKETISSKFHHTLIAAFKHATLKVSKKTGIKKVVLSGGVFNNDIILNKMTQALEEKNLKVYTHTKVPCGDGGICLGQAVVAAALEAN